MTDVKLLREIVEQLEWSDEVQGQGTSMGARDGYFYPSCPTCGGTRDAVREFQDPVAGHLSGCKIARALGRETLLAEGKQGSLTL